MARREIMLAIIGAGALAALVLSRRASGALRTYDTESGLVYDGADWENAYAIDNAHSEPGLIEDIMATLQPNTFESLNHQNVRAFLAMIGEFEGGPQGYNALFGGGRFDSFDDHPRIVVRASGYASSAAGKYQILARTWDDIKDKIGAPDFTPFWQDVAAVYLIRRRGALADVVAGNFATAMQKVAKEWASLPGAGYGQPERALTEAQQIYASAGGNFA